MQLDCLLPELVSIAVRELLSLGDGPSPVIDADVTIGNIVDVVADFVRQRSVELRVSVGLQAGTYLVGSYPGLMVCSVLEILAEGSAVTDRL